MLTNYKVPVRQGMSNWQARKAAKERGCVIRNGKGSEWVITHRLRTGYRVITRSTRKVASRAVVVFLKRVEEEVNEELIRENLRAQRGLLVSILGQPEELTDEEHVDYEDELRLVNEELGDYDDGSEVA